MIIEVGAATHAGRVRPVNEDSFLARDQLAVVADGMGGHAAGDVASALTIEQFRSLGIGALARPEQIQEAIERANRAIVSEATASPERAGMGATITGIALIEYGGTPHWLVFNVGDSRVYRVADGRATQLTVDHSEVAELVALGRITPLEARHHPLRHIVTRSLGVDPPPVPDVWIFPPSAGGDVFVACSDGLTTELDDDRIGAVASAGASPGGTAEELVREAVESGGRDNVTVVVLAAAPSDVDDVSVNTTPRSSLSGRDG